MIETFYQPYLEAAYKDFVHSYLVWFFQVNKFNIIFPDSTAENDLNNIPRPSFDQDDGIQDFINLKFGGGFKADGGNIFKINEKDFQSEKIKLLIRKTANALRKVQIDNGSETEPNEDKIKKYFEDKINEVLTTPKSSNASGLGLSKINKVNDKPFYTGLKGTDKTPPTPKAFDYYRGIGTERFLKPYIDNKYISDDQSGDLKDSTTYLKDEFNKKELVGLTIEIPKNAILRLALLIDIILDGI